ncbi:bifunctional biotin--[acetyl-CoA-carboxylase] ligase/biotin operon repressor BirA [Corallincola luteus]|uniref:Bifunctional ligase/repressor BirA n=1 Tax=Corallincola luteus TaxID=1775177 RepID=A0ABY2AFP5_9GAMM|nr:bifunctional biotin--[acetyl-CoA-carboxylase] ligase/biotin operon repressor BirA [Corallincola luteus]TCI01203.1 bifunctional biotin--[acetyl-CoA-carboxylase] ligase/biotin operon repressor BirA [Corallincola luteus]
MNNKQQHILKRLATGEFCSGERLGEELAISRAAIAKHISALQALGIDIFSVPGKGYRLAKSLDLLSQETIQSALAQCGSQLPLPFVTEVIDSTNQYLLDRLARGVTGEKASDLLCGQACLAEMQTAGRGRRGRHWISPYAANLYLSLYWRLSRGIQGAMGLSLVVGVVIAEVLKEYGVTDVRLKWPNDIYIGDRKLGGVLVELVGQVDDACDLVIGLGLNISMPQEKSTTIDQPWTDLSQTLDCVPPRNELAVAILLALTAALTTFDRNGFRPFVSRWRTFDLFDGKVVKLLMGNRQVTGICRGVDEQGALVLEQEGVLVNYMGGEISLRSVAT